MTVRRMNAETLIPAILLIVGVSAFIGAFFGGFAIAGKRREAQNYVLRGILWGLLLFFGGLILLAALAFGACLLMFSGWR